MTLQRLTELEMACLSLVVTRAGATLSHVPCWPPTWRWRHATTSCAITRSSSSVRHTASCDTKTECVPVVLSSVAQSLGVQRHVGVEDSLNAFIKRSSKAGLSFSTPYRPSTSGSGVDLSAIGRTMVLKLREQT